MTFSLLSLLFSIPLVLSFSSAHLAAASSIHPFAGHAPHPLATRQQDDDWEPPPIKTAVIRVNVSKTYQVFDGMGVSEAFQRSRMIYGYDGLSPENTQRVLDLLFSNTTGAGLTILRNGIGSSVESPYDLMKSIQPLSPGILSSSTPSYSWDGDDNGQVRLTRDAIARGVKMIYADAWSAPGYMKNNSNDSHGGSLCGVMEVNCTSGDWRTAYAEYLVQYLKFYEKEGIHVDHVGFLNEPDLK
jgi:O-glycosyl hydrolase